MLKPVCLIFVTILLLHPTSIIAQTTNVGGLPKATENVDFNLSPSDLIEEENFETEVYWAGLITSYEVYEENGESYIEWICEYMPFRGYQNDTSKVPNTVGKALKDQKFLFILKIVAPVPVAEQYAKSSIGNQILILGKPAKIVTRNGEKVVGLESLSHSVAERLFKVEQ